MALIFFANFVTIFSNRGFSLYFSHGHMGESALTKRRQIQKGCPVNKEKLAALFKEGRKEELSVLEKAAKAKVEGQLVPPLMVVASSIASATTAALSFL